jgi:hypothetical protein
MRTDTARVQEMLMQALPGAMRGDGADVLRMPWPELVKAPGRTGLWWDK